MGTRAPVAYFVRCVRCGTVPRTDGTFLCAGCKTDPRARREIAEIMRARPDFLSQRRYAITTYGWVGGWGPADRRS